MLRFVSSFIITLCVFIVFVILNYGFITTFGSEFGDEKICTMIDKLYDSSKWFFVMVFVSGLVLEWKESMLLSLWSVIIMFAWNVKSIRA